jgi:hypothetical protein
MHSQRVRHVAVACSSSGSSTRLARLSTAHGLAARVEGAEALSTTNVFRLETTGVAILCVVYLDASGPAHMRYTIRRLRRKLPKATIILGCWVKDIDPAALELLREGAKADLVAASLGEAVRLCIEATGVEEQRQAGTVYHGSGLRSRW